MSTTSIQLLHDAAGRSPLQAQIDLVRHYVGLLETIICDSCSDAAKICRSAEEALG